MFQFLTLAKGGDLKITYNLVVKKGGSGIKQYDDNMMELVIVRVVWVLKRYENITLSAKVGWVWLPKYDS